jgi:hypothetical protein
MSYKSPTNPISNPNPVLVTNTRQLVSEVGHIGLVGTDWIGLIGLKMALDIYITILQKWNKCCKACGLK